MSERLDALEERITVLRAEVRRAVRARDAALARSLRAELRGAERAWDQALAADDAADDLGGHSGVPGDDLGGGPGAVSAGSAPGSGGAGLDHGKPRPGSGRPGLDSGGHGHGLSAPGSGLGGVDAPLVPVREQVHQALALLGVPASAKMIVAVHGALRAGSLRGTQFASLRRDEERSFRSSPFSRPYYLCAALTDRLSPSRGLLTVSTWPLERRTIGPLSPRVDFLTTAIRVAEHVARLEEEAGEPPLPAAGRLLARLAHNVPGVPPTGPGAFPDPALVVKAARAELEFHAEADAAARAEIAARARARLGDAERLFGGATLRPIREEAS
ncbi:hypothetical protein Skr01_08190 [Sphaerisporangium krabiense]|uniref:Uncharacterized protein n=1 Tax=Sphaerisporangium krabiense TaxID=763782 RepID=A0A7W8ZC55_9ACTN|nr:hypothetical protein [Sphaerisporangium krabiense]MBB5631317.1 hypothetical protein [Sphaerisporangium krabiense]GII60734.1 hypothetical protein Skr01_08190 [Sphaerisporangium krabiense]